MEIATFAKKNNISLAKAEEIFALADKNLAALEAEGVDIKSQLKEFDAPEMAYRSQYAREHDTPDGFRHFFWCITGMELRPHNFLGMIVPSYWAKGLLSREELDNFFSEPEAEPFQYIYKKLIGYKVPKMGIVIRAAREMAKTLTMTIVFTAFRIGHEPHKMSYLVQIADDSAKENASKIAEIIQDSPGWRMTFPSIVPDIKRGWAEGGYFVRDTGMTDDEWSKKCATRKAPTMMATGYASRLIIGKRQDGMANIDDIHDLTNTTSARELRNTLDKVRSDFMMTPTAEAWLSFVGTPWVEGDTLDYVANTGEFVVVDIPAYMERQNGEWVMPVNQWVEEGEYLYLWPEERGFEWVRKKWATNTPPEFARMVQLNITNALEKHYNYQLFENAKIQWRQWPMVIGVDPVATISAISGKEGGTSHFVGAFAMKTPYNNIVIADGIYEKCDAEEGERLLALAARTNPTFKNISIEIDGAGILFAQLIKRLTGMRINPHSTAEIRKVLKGVTGKERRQYDFLYHLFAQGAVVVSDADTPFLNAVRRYLDKFPNFTKNDPAWDVGDALLLAVFDMPEIWVHVVSNVVIEESKDIWEPRRQQPSPWASLGEHYARP